MISEAAVDALGGAVGSVLAMGLTYPLTTVMQSDDSRLTCDRRIQSVWSYLSEGLEKKHLFLLLEEALSFLSEMIKTFSGCCWQVSTWQALDHKNEDKRHAGAEVQDTSMVKAAQLARLPSPLKELAYVSDLGGWLFIWYWTPTPPEHACIITETSQSGLWYTPYHEACYFPYKIFSISIHPPSHLAVGWWNHLVWGRGRVGRVRGGIVGEKVGNCQRKGQDSRTGIWSQMHGRKWQKREV
jgi:hypothetical protein